MALKPVLAVQDNDAAWYIIPTELQSLYNQLLHEEVSDDGQSFSGVFSQYKVGWQLNTKQLYAEMAE